MSAVSIWLRDLLHCPGTREWGTFQLLENLILSKGCMWLNYTLTGKMGRYDIHLTNNNAFSIIKIPYPTGGVAHE